MANTSAFQAEDAGSIPVVPSLITSANQGGGDFALVGEGWDLDFRGTSESTDPEVGAGFTTSTRSED